MAAAPRSLRLRLRHELRLALESGRPLGQLPQAPFGRSGLMHGGLGRAELRHVGANAVVREQDARVRVGGFLVGVLHDVKVGDVAPLSVRVRDRLALVDQLPKPLGDGIELRTPSESIVARAVVLKYTPQLRFVLDESISRGNRVLAILDEIELAIEDRNKI